MGITVHSANDRKDFGFTLIGLLDKPNILGWWANKPLALITGPDICGGSVKF